MTRATLDIFTEEMDCYEESEKHFSELVVHLYKAAWSKFIPADETGFSVDESDKPLLKGNSNHKFQFYKFYKLRCLSDGEFPLVNFVGMEVNAIHSVAGKVFYLYES